MTIIKHGKWKWDFDGSHTAYGVVSQITDQYKYDDRCKYIYRFEQLKIGNNNQSTNDVEATRTSESCMNY